MAFDAQAVRKYVSDLLKKRKALTEREVKKLIAKAFKLNPKEVGAAVIRDVRKAMGIDRPRALAHARAMLTKEPLLRAKKVINEINRRFGIRLGAPDVSRLRPKAARRARRGGPAAKAAKPKAAARPVRRRRGRPPKAAAGAPATRRRRRGRRPGRPPGSGAGRISMAYQGSGSPSDLAAFFRSLAK